MDGDSLKNPAIDITDANTSANEDDDDDDDEEEDEEDTTASSEDSLCIHCTQRISDRDSHNCEGTLFDPSYQTYFSFSWGMKFLLWTKDFCMSGGGDDNKLFDWALLNFEEKWQNMENQSFK